MSFSTPPSEEPVTLTIFVQGIPESQGNIRVGVYDSPAKFRSSTGVAYQLVQAAKKGNMTVKLSLQPGSYAVAVYHDANANGKLDTNFLGIPTEVYGFSNNARGTFGPPDFGDCLVTITGHTTISIRLD
jgi:uncharacterized protein (DUF2141 family)